MTHTIELTVTCDQPELDRLAALVLQWSAEVGWRDQHGLNSRTRAGKVVVHKFWVDGSPVGVEAHGGRVA